MSIFWSGCLDRHRVRKLVRGAVCSSRLLVSFADDFVAWMMQHPTIGGHLGIFQSGAVPDSTANSVRVRVFGERMCGSLSGDAPGVPFRGVQYV